ncbi:hypothetical protein [Zhengella mangrovi]|uniref:hypothetical protein n=1 Tax=Zhengella mangrovi TaxID=1982044 RepID=UPI001054D689|nr:hypothetical protein [Zhengella mangrovi]
MPIMINPMANEEVLIGARSSSQMIGGNGRIGYTINTAVVFVAASVLSCEIGTVLPFRKHYERHPAFFTFRFGSNKMQAIRKLSRSTIPAKGRSDL